MIRLVIDGAEIPYAELTLTYHPRLPPLTWDQPMPYQPPTTTVEYLDGTGTIHRLNIEGGLMITREDGIETITIDTPPIDKL